VRLTHDLLINLITEMMEHGGLCAEVHPELTHSEWKDHKREEEEKTKAMAKISIQPKVKLHEADDSDYVSKLELQKILKKWETATYDSDEDRWMEYAKDIQNLVGK